MNKTGQGKKLRATIIAAGEVQRVGYRYAVQDIANTLGLSGYVRNLPDGGVEVVAEGTREQLEKFFREIKLDQAPIHVREVEVKYGKTKGLRGFRIRYGKMPEELSEGFGAGLKYIVQVRDEVGASGEDIKGVREEVKGARGDIRALGDEIRTGFQLMDQKYGTISETLKELTQEFRKFTQLIQQYLKR